MLNRGIGSFLLVFLCGIMHAQQLQISPQTLSFKNQVLHIASPSQTVAVTNTGSLPVTIDSISASGTYSATSECSVLMAGESCSIDISFAPDALGVTDGEVTVISSAQAGTQTISLSGTAIVPLRLTPTSLNFGTIPVGSASQPQSVKITNQQGSAMSITSVVTSGDYSQSNNCPASLAAGSSCTVRVVFRPTVGSVIRGALSVAADTTMPAPVGLLGTGSGNVPSIVSLSSTALNFGTETMDSFTATQTVILTNTSSTSSLTFQNVSVSGGAAFFLGSTRPDCKGMLAPGAHCNLVVSFGPPLGTGPASYTGAVTVVDSDVTSPQTISLSGTGALGVLYNPTTLHFPPQKVGTSSAEQIVTVTGTRQGPEVLLISISASGDYSVESAGTPPCFEGLILVGSCQIGVKFTPTRTGAVSGAVTIANYPLCGFGTCAEPAVLNLMGTGD